MAGPGLAVPAGTRNRTLRSRDMKLLFSSFWLLGGCTADLGMEAPGLLFACLSLLSLLLARGQCLLASGLQAQLQTKRGTAIPNPVENVW